MVLFVESIVKILIACLCKFHDSCVADRQTERRQLVSLDNNASDSIVTGR